VLSARIVDLLLCRARQGFEDADDAVEVGGDAAVVGGLPGSAELLGGSDKHGGALP